MKPLISIIVPVYKVEAYLQKCLDSIVNQTYQNLEIILVDDGSPDNCGVICDEYAGKDGRIKVIHKENGGLSSARNAALKIAAGDYIGFVDSDDWVEPDMFGYLSEGMQKHKADIAVCGRIEVYTDRQKWIGWPEERVLNREQAIGILLEDTRMQNYVCDKLWKRELFQGIEFPEGRSFEDIATTYRLFEKADTILCLPDCKYFYLQRSDGIVHSRSLDNEINYHYAVREQYLNLKDRYPQFQERMTNRIVSHANRVFGLYRSSPAEKKKQYKRQVHEIARFVRGYPSATEIVMRKWWELGPAGRLKFKLMQYPYWWSFAMVQCVEGIYKVIRGKSL